MNKDHIEFHETAVEDLKASIQLYKNKLFPQSFFHLQQSIEKAVKFLALNNNLAQYNELHNKISHKTTEIFKRSLSKSKNYSILNSSFTANVDLEEGYKEVEAFVKDEPIEVVTLEILKLIHSIANDEIEIPFEKNLNSIGDFIDLLKVLDPNNSNLLILSKIYQDNLNKKYFEKMLYEFKVKLNLYNRAIFILFALNVLLEKHVSLVRYPKDKISPAKIYNKDHPIINNLPFLHAAHDFCLKNIV